ncbi:MAG: hypothetical protein C4289_05725, partial [Chloroflexota bacterium]
GDKAYGPGVADMKAGIVMNMFVLAAFAKFGGAPGPLVGLFTGDEEIGSPEGRKVIEAEARGARVVFNSEPGRPSGNVVTGRIVRVDADFAVVDVGLKSEGRVPLREFAPPGQKPEVKPGDVIVLTIMEHHSNLVPWQLLAEETGAQLECVGITSGGLLDLEQLDRALAKPVKLVAVVHAANALGTINPVQEIVRRAHGAGALCLVDGAQSVPHMPVDVQEIGCDFLAFSGHKMLGPTGIGVLWGRLELLERMPPFIAGGGMIRRVTLARTTFADVPERFEGGTPAIAQAIGLGVAVDYLSALGMAAVRQHEQELTAYALERLTSVGGVRIFGPLDATNRGGVLSFYLADIHPHDVASILDQQGVAIRAGHHCCQPLMDFLGVPATARASFYIYNSRDDVDALVEGLHMAKKVFGTA